MNVMTDTQKLAVRCAYADLLGALQAFEQGDLQAHDWTAHQQTLDDLLAAFPGLDLKGETT